MEMHTLCNIPEEDKQIKVTWYAWETTEGLPNKVQKSGTLGNVLNFVDLPLQDCGGHKNETSCNESPSHI